MLQLLHKHRIEKVLVVNDEFALRGLITVKDIQKTPDNPNAALGQQRTPAVGAAVGVGGDTEQRIEALVAAGVDVIIVDTAHGHSQGVHRPRRAGRKKRFPSSQVIGGNIVTGDAALALMDAGADAVKVGVGPVRSAPRASSDPDGADVVVATTCASEGTVEVLLEPCVAGPLLAVVGDSPAARALSELAPAVGWRVTGEVAGGPNAVRHRGDGARRRGHAPGGARVGRRIRRAVAKHPAGGVRLRRPARPRGRRRRSRPGAQPRRPRPGPVR